MKAAALSTAIPLAFGVLACSAASNTRESTPEEESFVRDLLFGNNPTGQTYYAQYFVPASVRIAGQCVPMTSSHDDDIASRVRIYREQGVVAAFSPDNGSAYPGSEIGKIIAGLTRDVPRNSPFYDLPKQRRKQGDGNVICVGPHVDAEVEAAKRPLTIHLTRDRAAFDALWRRPAPRLGYRSPSRRDTPGCYVEVRAAPSNEVMRTDVHLLMPDWEISTFRSRPFLGCLVRGTLAAFGLPGVLNKPDGFLLLGNTEQAVAAGGEKTEYWDWRPIAASQLYDGPGATWEQVQAEWRRLHSRLAHKQRTN